MPLRSVAFLLYFFGSSAGTFVYPVLGVLCYIFLYHVYPQATWWGKALEPFGIRYAYVCGICLLAGTMLNLNRLKFGRQFMQPLEWSMLSLFMLLLFSAVVGVDWNYRTNFIIDKMVKVFLFLLLMTHVVVTKRRVWYVAVLLVFLTLYLGHEARNAPLSAFTNNRLDGIGGPDFRESAGLAIHLLALLPFVGVLLRRRELGYKVLGFFAGCYGLNAILLCRARSAFLAGIITGIAALYYVPKRHRRWVVVALVLAGIGGSVLSDSFFRERMLTIVKSEEERDHSAASRLIIWAAAWEMFKEHPFGVGIGQFERNIHRYAPPDADVARRDAHNTFVLCAAETGVFGLGAFVLTLVLAWQTLGQANRRARRDLVDSDLLQLLIFANRLALLVYMLSGIFVSRLYTEGMWMLIALPVCLARAVENEVRVEARETVIVQVSPQGSDQPMLAWPPGLLGGGLAR